MPVTPTMDGVPRDRVIDGVDQILLQRLYMISIVILESHVLLNQSNMVHGPVVNLRVWLSAIWRLNKNIRTGLLFTMYPAKVLQISGSARHAHLWAVDRASGLFPPQWNARLGYYFFMIAILMLLNKSPGFSFWCMDKQAPALRVCGDIDTMKNFS